MSNIIESLISQYPSTLLLGPFDRIGKPSYVNRTDVERYIKPLRTSSREFLISFGIISEIMVYMYGQQIRKGLMAITQFSQYRNKSYRIRTA
jgi:hypothetical protein